MAARSIRMYLLAALPDAHRLARRATLDITELTDDPLLLLAAALHRGSGSTPPARSRKSGHACSWKAPPRRRSSHWPRPAMGSRSFPPLCDPRGHRSRPASGSPRCLDRQMGAHRGDPQRFLAPYAEQFVASSWPIAGTTIPAASSSGARRAGATEAVRTISRSASRCGMRSDTKVLQRAQEVQQILRR